MFKKAMIGTVMKKSLVSSAIVATAMAANAQSTLDFTYGGNATIVNNFPQNAFVGGDIIFNSNAWVNYGSWELNPSATESIVANGQTTPLTGLNCSIATGVQDSHQNLCDILTFYLGNDLNYSVAITVANGTVPNNVDSSSAVFSQAVNTILTDASHGNYISYNDGYFDTAYAFSGINSDSSAYAVGNLTTMNLQVESTPEPGTMALEAIGGTALLLAGLNRAKKNMPQPAMAKASAAPARQTLGAAAKAAVSKLPFLRGRMQRNPDQVQF